MSELRRRAVHASGALLPLSFLTRLLTYDQLGLVLVVGSLAVVGLETIRLKFDAVPGPLDRLFAQLTREYEQDNLGGYALYAFSMTGVALVFPAFAAIPAMLMLTLGDPISGVLGSAQPGERKSLSVMAVTFLVSFALATLTVPVLRPGDVMGTLFLASAVGALGATVADGFKPVVAGYVIDDNATIPPAAALGIFVVVAVL